VNSTVRKLLEGLPQRSEWVFSHNNGGQIKSIKDAWNNAVKRAGIGHCRFHDLRHTWASEMGEHTDLRTLMDLGGWKTAEIPMRYVHPVEDHKRDCLERLAQRNSHNSLKREKIAA
jgi:integrase